MSGLAVEVVAPAAIGPADRARMYELMARYYDGVQWPTFLGDLDEKQFVMVVRDEAGVAGFSTAKVFEMAAGPGGPQRVLFSGDTILDKPYQGHAGLLGQWLDHVVTAIAPSSPLPLWWMLVSKGHRTYRCMSAWFNVFYPSCTRPAPPEVGDLMHRLGRRYGGDGYDPRTGVIHHPGGQRLREGDFGPSARDLRNPHVQFFLASNPGWRLGDELLCLAEITPPNLRPALRRRLAATGGGRT